MIMKKKKHYIDLLIIKNKEQGSLDKEKSINKNTRMRSQNLFHVILSCLSFLGIVLRITNA